MCTNSLCKLRIVLSSSFFRTTTLFHNMTFYLFVWPWNMSLSFQKNTLSVSVLSLNKKTEHIYNHKSKRVEIYCMTHLNDSEYYSTSLIFRANNGVNREDSINNLLTQIIILPSLFLRQIFKGKCNFIVFCLHYHIISSSYRLEFQ